MTPKSVYDVIEKEATHKKTKQKRLEELLSREIILTLNDSLDE